MKTMGSILLIFTFAFSIRAQHPNSPGIPSRTTGDYNAWAAGTGKHSTSAYYYQLGKQQAYIKRQHQYLLEQGYIYENGRYVLPELLPEPEPTPEPKPFLFSTPTKKSFLFDLYEVFRQWKRESILDEVALLLFVFYVITKYIRFQISVNKW